MNVKEYPAIGERVYSETLENGLAIFVMPKAGYTKTFAAFATKYGGCDRRFKLGGEYIDTPAGVAHFLEHKMFDMPDGQDAMTTLSALGASANAYTSSESTCYLFECTDNFEQCLRELLRFVSTPYFTDASVAKEQGIIGQEIRMGEDSPGRAVYENLLSAMYSYHPVRESIAGTVESIAEITAQTLYDCHRVFYNPSNMVLSVAGSVDPEIVFAIARELVTAEAGEIPERDYGPKEPDLPEKNLVEKKMAVALPLYMIGVKLKPQTEEQALYRQTLIAELAMEQLIGPSSPLYSKLYEDGVINDSFGTGESDSAGVVFAYVSAEGRDSDKVLTALLAEAERVTREGVDAALFGRLQRSAIGGILRSLNAPESCCLTMADDYMAGYDSLKGLEVFASLTTEDIERFITENIRPEKLTLSVINPIESDKE